MEPNTIPLRDLHLPEATGLWPLAPGWWVVIAIVVVLLAIWCRQMWISWRDGASRRHALRQFEDFYAAYRKNGDVVAFANELSELLRRTMIAYAPREEVAGLTGQAWLDWLDHDLPIPQFSGAAGRGLLELPYRDPESGVADFDVDEMLSAVRMRLRTPVGSSR
jgi:hypothetical protein